jgi:hypothetical protein
MHKTKSIKNKQSKDGSRRIFLSLHQTRRAEDENEKLQGFATLSKARGKGKKRKTFSNFSTANRTVEIVSSAIVKAAQLEDDVERRERGVGDANSFYVLMFNKNFFL